MKNRLFLYLLPFLLLIQAKNVLAGACVSARFHYWQDMGCNQAYTGFGGPSLSQDCNGSDCDKGMPRWWINEPYVNLHVSDTPLSYHTSSGQEIAFEFFYKQNAPLPESDEINTYTGQDEYRKTYYCGTNSTFTHNWNVSIQIWDANWENWSQSLNYPVKYNPPSWTVYSHGYQAMLFQPSGGINYFNVLQGSRNVYDPKSLVKISSVISGQNYPQVETVTSAGIVNAPSADTNGIYWGEDANVGMQITYPDGSQDIFGLTATPVIAKQVDTQMLTIGTSKARLLLTRRIDPQGRSTRLGYESLAFTNYWKCPSTTGIHYFRIKYVVDCDGRTNTFKYNNNAPTGYALSTCCALDSTNLVLSALPPQHIWQLTEIDDPYGRKATFQSDPGSGLLTGTTDAAGLTNTFQYDVPKATNICYLPDPLQVYSIDDGGIWRTNFIGLGTGGGWITNIITPYGNTAFTYFNSVENGATNGVVQKAIYVSEPTGTKQLYYYLHKAVAPDGSLLIPTTAQAPTVPGVTNFDDGNYGSNHYQLNYRNSIYWGRRQFAALSTGVQSLLPGNISNPLAALSVNDFKKGRVRNWLWQPDNMSISESLSSERDPSPDSGGQTEGLRTWYSYPGKSTSAPETIGSFPQISCIAKLLPDSTSQFTIYNYYGISGIPGYPPGAGFVSDSESSYSMPDNSIGLLTNWYHYAANSIDLISITNSGGQYVNLGYNGSHQLTNSTNALNQVTTFSWDVLGNSGNLTGIGLPSGGRIILNYYNYLFSSSYTQSNMVKQIIVLPEGRTNTINEYSAGLPASVTDDKELTITNTWDGLNRLTSTAYPDNSYVSNIYYRLDLNTSKDRLTNWTYYAYDGLQHLTSVTNANNAITAYSWCGCGSLNQIIDPENGVSSPTTFSYDNQGHLTGILYPDNSSITYNYDLVGRMTSAVDGASRFINTTFNNQNLPTSVANANGTLQSVLYDSLNRPVQITDANNVCITNTYDPLNQLLKRTWPGNINESYGYSTNGLIAYTNRDQKVTRYGRDGAKRLLAVTNANTEVTQFSYDSLNKIIKLIDGNINTTRWGYNQYGWLTGKTNGLNQTVFTNCYNANGWITTRWTPEKGVTGYSYDNIGNLKSVSYAQQTNSFAYDALNRLTNMVDAVGRTIFGYTPAGQLQSENGPWANDTLTYTYVQGLRTALTLSQTASNWSQTYGYDSGWRMRTLNSPAGSFGYCYNFQPASLLITGIQLPNGANIVNSYDSLARLTNTALNNHWSHALDSYTYTLDALGLRTNIVRNLGLTSSTITVGFDNIGQLTTWSGAEVGGKLRQNEQFGFGYDAAHNLHTRNNGNLAQTFLTDAANQLNNISRTGTFTESGVTSAPATNVMVNGQAAQIYGDFTFAATNLSLSVSNNVFTNIALNVYNTKTTNIVSLNLPLSVNLGFDANGNLTNDGLRSLAYDSENQLTNITQPGSWKSDFVYDGLNRRRVARDFVWQTNKWILTNETHYVYDGRLLLQERSTNNNPLVTYTRGLDLGGSLSGAGGIDGLLARTDTNGSTFYHADAIGNITALIDSQENIVARYLYNPFGKPIGQSGPLASANVMQSSSKPAYRGVVDFGLRWYSPDLDRWLNQDPIGEAGGLNLYRFNQNNALSFVDPDGRAPALNGVSYNLNNNSSIAQYQDHQFGQDYGIGLHNPPNYGPGIMLASTGASMVPGVGEVMDLSVLGDPNSRWWEKGLAAGSLALNALTDELLPNAGAFIKCKTGPKPKPHGPHNEKIGQRVKELKDQGHTQTHGGDKTEEVIQTPGGTKSSRRPDITTQDPSGNVYRENVGKTKSDGTPVSREVDALNDIEDATGQRPVFTPYDQ